MNLPTAIFVLAPLALTLAASVRAEEASPKGEANATAVAATAVAATAAPKLAQAPSFPSIPSLKAASLSPAAAPAAPRKARRNLLDLNKDGRVSIGDVFKAAGLRSHVGNVVGIGIDGRVGMRNPLKVGAEALIDLAEDGRIDLHDPTQLVGVQIADFHRLGKLSYKGGALNFTRIWRY